MHQNQYLSPFEQSLEYKFHQPLIKRKARLDPQSLENRTLLLPAPLSCSEIEVRQCPGLGPKKLSQLKCSQIP